MCHWRVNTSGSSMDKSVFCTVRWSNHSNNVNRFLSVSYAEEKYTDVALACDGHVLKAHKMILAGCSPYFENMFSMYCVPNLCVAVEGIAYPILQLVLEFMYTGEIRVKHSELENLVKAGVQLKVKGLDAVKLNDLTRGAERTTVIARPTDGNQNLKLARGSRPATHSPTSSMPKVPKIPSDTGDIPIPLPKLKQEPTQVLQENSDSPDGPSTSKSLVEADSEKSEKKELSPITSPSKPLGLASASKRKVGQWLDSLEKVEQKLGTEEPDPLPTQTSKRTKKRRVARTVMESKVPRAPKRLEVSDRVEAKEDPGEEVDVPVSPSVPQKSPLSSPKESTVETNLEPEKTDEKREEVDALVNPILTKEDSGPGMDPDESNKDLDEPAERPPATKKAESSTTPGTVEVTTTRSRTIKKPARMADSEFNFEPDALYTKKRRSRKADGVGSVNRPKRKP